MAHSLKLIFGAYPFFEWSREVQEEFLDVLEKGGVKDIDTARSYPDSEKILGELGAPKRFIIHTKVRAFNSGSLQKDKVLLSAKETLEALKTDAIDTYFLHSPDPDTPIEDTLSAIQEIYKDGKFKHFGLSNFSPEQVQEAYDTAKKHNWVLPTVYQGNYSAVARHSEDKLFPVLRKLKISFYAYSPIAGGFLVQSADKIKAGTTGGRFDRNTSIGHMYHRLYSKPALLDALSEWEKIASEAKVSKAAMAYRWVAYHSALKPELGDGIVIGASKTTQLEETLKTLKDGPLDEKTAAAIAKIWDTVKHEAPIDNYVS